MRYADRDQNAGHESCGESFRSQRKCHNDAVREIKGPQLEDFPALIKQASLDALFKCGKDAEALKEVLPIQIMSPVRKR